jgi:hypothetical protein
MIEQVWRLAQLLHGWLALFCLATFAIGARLMHEKEGNFPVRVLEIPVKAWDLRMIW